MFAYVPTKAFQKDTEINNSCSSEWELGIRRQKKDRDFLIYTFYNFWFYNYMNVF